LFDYRYWQQRQRDIESGTQGDVFPYPQEIRFPDSGALSQKLVANAC
jgi:isocitrate dehydrogenase kinase/phosphatase